MADPAISAAFMQVKFDDANSALTRLKKLVPSPHLRKSFAGFYTHFLTCLASAANPDRVLINLSRFLEKIADQDAFLIYLNETRRAIEVLVTLFSSSQFLTEIVLYHPDYFKNIVAYQRLAIPKSSDLLYHELKQLLSTASDDEMYLKLLRLFQGWEMLRIGVCDLLNLYDLPTVTRQLSNLADCIIGACLDLAATHYQTQPDILTVIAMGKLGGKELNYSSDIDLVFLSNHHPDLAQKVGESLITHLSNAAGEGLLYRVDMRLRPWGKVGKLVNTPSGYLAYLEHNARYWEKQALLKSRVVAGNHPIGNHFIKNAREYIFQGTEEQVRQSISALKEQTEAQLRQNGQDWGEVKLGAGSIRDVEFTVQLLQMIYGKRFPEILSGNTLDAIPRLAVHQLLSVEDSRILTEGYKFLRTVEHHLQMMDYRQTHRLPRDPQAINQLALRLGYRSDNPGEDFLSAYEQHSQSVRSIYLNHIAAQINKAGNDMPPSDGASMKNEFFLHLDRMTPSYADRFSQREITVHALLANRLNINNPVQIQSLLLADQSWQVTIVALDYPGALAFICGLMAIYKMNILSGDAFTYEPAIETDSHAPHANLRRKIVDVFHVKSMVDQAVSLQTWTQYGDDLAEYLRLLQRGARREAHGRLAIRVAGSLQQMFKPNLKQPPPLFPIDIQISNHINDTYTVMQIRSLDTFGFLYELTNALALTRTYISRVSVDTHGDQVHDTLWITDENGNKITSPSHLQELRAATVLIKHFSHLLPLSPNPEAALLHFGDFINDFLKQINWSDKLASLEKPEVLNALARLLGVSNYLWEDFLRMQHSNLFPVVTDVDRLRTAKSRDQLQSELSIELAKVHQGPQTPDDHAPWVIALNEFKDREMFRVDMRHILGLTEEFWDFASELTDLAEVVINNAFHLCHEDLRSEYGTPLLDNGQISQMAVLAQGKLGGREIGFASDIELMFVYAGNGRTSGQRQITTAEFYEKFVQYFVNTIYSRREGIFQIDLQLRPYGKAGSLSVSLEAFRRYFVPGGPAWAYERQALVRLRPIAGDRDLGALISSLRDEFVYESGDFDVTAMRAMRERQIRHLVRGGSFNPKFSPGGLVDIEYTVQALQIWNGKMIPAVRQTNTRTALAALAEAGILKPDDYQRLRKAHTFLRWLIDSLRVVRGNAKDMTMPPVSSEEYAFLARRMNYRDNPDRLHQELIRYTEDVRLLSEKLLLQGATG
ncbi:MAG TPA: hypothetical protein VIO61_11830 [Anaerolineaceae bacterium]